jgi:hypothetical protein
MPWIAWVIVGAVLVIGLMWYVCGWLNALRGRVDDYNGGPDW